jgi:hypothetical protein
MTKEERYKEIHNKYVRLYKDSKKKGHHHVADWYKDIIEGYRQLLGLKKKGDKD